MKQRKRIQILLLAALSGLSVMGYAQGKVCQGTAYEIKELVAPSAPSTFQWVENGVNIPNANSATYTIPTTQAVGKYTYVRNSLKEGCEWASSNLFTVEVITCGTITDGAQTGSVGTFVDPRDNKVYKIVMMPDDQVWFAENLNYQKDLVFNQRSDVANGVPYTNSDNGVPAIGSFWCPAAVNAVVSTDKNTCGVYGALYTWETVMMVDGKWADENKQSSTWDESWVSSNYFTMGTLSADNKANVNNARANRGICPDGWHVPTDYEWADLLDIIEGNSIYTMQTDNTYIGTKAGVQLKSACTHLGGDSGDGAWLDSETRGTDDFRFSIVPAGFRLASGAYFNSRYTGGHCWSSTVISDIRAYWRVWEWQNPGVRRYYSFRSHGISVRCVRNKP
jgi:uncharacterized protein (TIGR02145 family)